MSTYSEFLARKSRGVTPDGLEVSPDEVHPFLFEWQREIVCWAAQVGRAAIFADCGLGKSAMQIEWARLMAGDGSALILAPLSVARQTVREGEKVDVDVRYVRHPDEVTGSGVWITNYEMVGSFDPAAFRAVVLDESSILKNAEGKTRRTLTEAFSTVPYRLACTATPAPNDVAELTNHAEFLGHMPRNEMLAAYFVHDEIGWRIKGHAVGPMHEWMAGWAVALRRPSDVGYDDTGYDLPPLNIVPEVVEVAIEAEGQLFPTDLGGIGGRSKVRRQTLEDRCARAAELANRSGQWIVWCALNDEADRITDLVDGAVNVRGNDTPEQKAEALEAFQDGEHRVLVTKVQIAGFGMNFQNAHQMVFCGLGDSFEAYYQAIRRCWRFGQTEPVDVHVVVSDLERQIVDNVRRKESETSQTTDLLVAHSPLRKDNPDVDHRTAALRYRRIPRRMLATTARR